MWQQKTPGHNPILLTANNLVFVYNDRLNIRMTGTPELRTLILRIYDVGPEDQGTYTCAVPTLPDVAADVEITVIGGKKPNVSY